MNDRPILATPTATADKVRRRLPIAALAMLWLLSCVPLHADQKSRWATKPEDAGPDYLVQGEYLVETSEPKKFGLQVVALGDNKFSGVVLEGGLTGDGWERGQPRDTTEGQTDADGVTRLAGEKYRIELASGQAKLFDSAGQPLAEGPRVERTSPMLDAPPPEGAIVLFDGNGADQFQPGRMGPGKLLLVPAATRQPFGDCKLHVEFRTPFAPTLRGQSRGNSGVYLQRLYEVQILDSFGLEGSDNECGAIYSMVPPRVNMCFPPLAWQTFDIEFTGARYSEAGEKTAPAVISVVHNGVLVQDHVAVPRSTHEGRNEKPGDVPLLFQYHSNPVQYRRIWILPLQPAA